MAISPIPNSVQRKVIFAGSEAVRGTAVAPDYKWYGELVVNRNPQTARRQEYDGTYGAGRILFGPDDLDGTYSTPLSFQQLANLARYGVAGGVAGVTDGETTPGFTYAYEPNQTADDLESATLIYNFEGIPFRSAGVMFNEWTIRSNIDDGASANWMWDGRLYVRTKELLLELTERGLTAVTTGGAPAVHILTPTGGGLTIDALIGLYLEIMSGPGASQVAQITDNDTTTITLDRTLSPAPTTASTIAVTDLMPVGISDSDRDDIKAEGTVLYIGEEADDMDEHQIVGRFKAFSATYQNTINPKRMMEDVGSYSAKVDRGPRLATVQITQEFDEFREVIRFEEEAQRLVRIAQLTGPIIDATATPSPTRMEAYLDFPDVRWVRMNEEVRNNNILVTYEGETQVDSSAGYEYAITVKTPDATLP